MHAFPELQLIETAGRRAVQQADDGMATKEAIKMPEYPDGGYGWVCVISTFLINAHTWGINSSYGVFLSFYLSSDIFPGTSALEYAFVGGLSIACAMFASPLATVLSQKTSIRLVLSLGTIFETVSLITTSFVKQNWQLFLSQGVCFGIGMGLCFVGSVGVVSHWFERRRSLVNGIVAGGSGIGGLVYSLAVGAMIPHLGFPWAMRILGILCFVVNMTCGNLLRLPKSKSAAAASRPAGSTFDLRALQEPVYITFLMWGVLSALGYVGLLFSLSSYTTAVGYAQHQGSIASALLNLGQAFGRPAVGLLSDRFGRINVAFAATLLSGIFCLVIWIFAASLGVIYFFAVFVGLVCGTLWAVAPPLGIESVGISRISGALGLFWFILTAPTAVAEAIALQLRGASGDGSPARPYLRVQLFVGIIYIGAAVCLIPFRLLLSKRQRESGKS